ncbi:MAG: SH3 domain-containing protein [Candidatus Sedimenticola sp. 20ELBAFRAG]
MKKLVIIAVSVLSLLVSGCMSLPTYMDQSVDQNSVHDMTNGVNYRINPGFSSAALSCVAMMPLELSEDSREIIEFSQTGMENREELTELAYDHQLSPEDKQELVRRFLQGHMAAYPTRLVSRKKVDEAIRKLGGSASDSAIAQRVGCRWLLKGNITKFSVVKMGLFSSLRVGTELQLVRANDGFIAWEGSHLASSSEGALPLSPIDLVVGIFKANRIINADEMESVTSDMARRLVHTMPLDPDNMLVAASRANQFFQVAASHLNLRTGPGTRFSVTKVLNGAEQVALLESSRDRPWYRVRTTDGFEGYVSKRYLEPLEQRNN